MLPARAFHLAATVLCIACAASTDDDYSRLRRMHLATPLDGYRAADIHDTFTENRNGKAHGAIDLPASRGTPVHAMSDGFIRKLFLSKRGGNTIYEYEPTQTYCFYYAHLDRYASGLKEGSPVRRGEVIGYVGSSGDASPLAPHLHLEITKLDAEKHWWLERGSILIRSFANSLRILSGITTAAPFDGGILRGCVSPARSSDTASNPWSKRKSKHECSSSNRNRMSQSRLRCSIRGWDIFWRRAVLSLPLKRPSTRLR